jgi:phosphoglycolate phosphatase
MSMHSERFRAAAFDLDGTLVDTMPDLAAAVNRMLATLGTRELPESLVRVLVGDGVEKLVLRALTESQGSPPAHPGQLSAALELFRRLYGRALFEHSKVYPGVLQTLRSLSDAGIAMCCITNKDSLFAVPLLELAGLSRFFAFTLCADRAEDRKPSPRLLLAACSRLGVKPAELLYVGDSNVDIMAARAAGCQIVAVTYGYGSERLGQPKGPAPDTLIDSLPDLIPFQQELLR